MFKLKCVIGTATLVAISLGTPLNAQQPTVYGPNNSSSSAFWYLGGPVSCCTGMTNMYWAQTTLTVVPPNNGNPTPSIQWSTDSPSKLSISPAPDGLSATLTALGASAFGVGYDIHVTVTYDGTPSSPFPVFLNTPYTMTTSILGNLCSGGVCGCQAAGAPPSYIGYVTVVEHGIADLTGTVLIPIDTNESLEKQQWTNATYAGGTFPPSSGIDTQWKWNTKWTGNKFTDYLSACASGPGTTSPPLTSYNPNGTSLIFNETQKFWVGTLTQFSGVCVQRGVVNLYTDHGNISPYATPITNKADCNSGNVIN